MKKIITLLVLAIAMNVNAQTINHHIGADTSTIRTFSEKIGGGMSENVRLNENKSIQRILQMQIETNMESRTVHGYVIQIYYGRLQKAKEMKEAFEMLYPDQIVNIE
ncbi:MAG: hypothetical protein PHD21_06375, partial [Flavobacteriales bacterium]|nr:hypothetical protein [Flavobacteriales bacterium]